MCMLYSFLKGGTIISMNLEQRLRESHSQHAVHVTKIYTHQSPKLDKIDGAKKCMMPETVYRSSLWDTARVYQIQKWILATNQWTENGQ